MILEQDEFKHFYRLHAQFMFFVSRKCPEISNTITNSAEYMGLEPGERFVAHSKFRETGPSLVTAYLKENPDNLKKSDLQIIESWKFAEHGDFFVFKQLKKYTVLLDGATTRAFAVLGPTQPVADLVLETPCLVETTLLPFKGKIVCDGLLASSPVSFGGGIKSSLNAAYREVKQNQGIINSLGKQPHHEKTVKKKTAKKKTAATPAQRLKRLVNTVHKKMKDIREKSKDLKKFEEETEPAFREWLDKTFATEKEQIEKLAAEIDELEFILDEANAAYVTGEFKSGAEAIDAARQEYSVEEAEDSDLDDEDYFGSGESPFGSEGSDDIPDFMVDELFAEFMASVRGIDVDDLSREEYKKAREQFKESVKHAQNGDASALEKALQKTGADESEDNVSAVKKIFRRLARKIHPDRNPDFNDEAQEIWNELKIAKEALDLNAMIHLETRWRVIQKETFDPDEEGTLKELQQDLNYEMREINAAIKECKAHPMWGSESGEPPKEFKKTLAEHFETQMSELEEEKQLLSNLIEELKNKKKRTKKKAPKAKKKTAPPKKKKAPAKKAAANKDDESPKATCEQTTFDFF